MARGKVKDPSKWAGSWGTRVQQSGEGWATGFIAAGPSTFEKAAAAGPHWQSQVSLPSSLSKFQGKLREVNFATVTATVNGPGTGPGKKKSPASGLNKQASVARFASVFGPKLVNIVNNLPARGPRGSAANRQRLNQLLDAVEATRGHNF